MDIRPPSPQTSFIPKKSVLPTTGSALAPSSISIFLLVAIIIFIVTIALSLGVFFYQRYLVSEVVKKNASLVKSKNAFDTSSIEEIIKLSKRIEASKDILGKHTLLSPIFKALEEKTLANVRFSSFSYESKKGSDIFLSLKGEAKGFNAVALQSDVFGEDPLFKNPIFSDLSLDESGNVIFKFRAALDPKSLLYANVLSGKGNGGASEGREE